jgi:hypothetical protein
LALGGAAALLLVAVVATHRRDARRVIPGGGPLPGPMPGGGPSWRPLPEGQAFDAWPGAILRGCVELPTFVPTALATPERVRDFAAKRGLVNVYSTTSRPADWPAACDADLYVQAQWGRGRERMPWPDGLTAAWVLA